MQVPDFKWFRLKCLALVLIVFASACENQSIRDVLESENRDLSSGGLVNAERKPNGTVKLTFRGVVGADTYELREAMKDKSLSEDELLSAKPLNERLLTVVQHAPGKLVYEFESAHIPLGGQFCYRLSMIEKSTGQTFELGASKCLMNDQNWFWSGVKSVTADELGRLVVKWDRLPADGATYEVFRRFPDQNTEFSDVPFNTILGGATAIDEVLEDRFPRCYRVRIRHTLFVFPDSNTQEVCLTEEEYLAQRLTTKDIEEPLFAGIKTIEAVKVDSLLAKMTSAVGFSSGINVLLTWDPAQDNLTRTSRIKYKVYRAEQSFGFDLDNPLAVTSNGQLSYTDKSISKGAVYYYLVRAVDEQGNIDQNVNQKILPLDLTPPVFSGLVIGYTKRNNTSVKVVLGWNPASDDQTPSQGILYQIFRSQSVGVFPDAPIGTVVGISQYEDGTTEKGQIYYYKVHALDKEGNRDTNNKVVTVNTGETPPIFQGVKTAVLNKGVGELRWEPAEDDETPTSAILYRVYRRLEDTSFNYKSPLFQVTGGQLQYSDFSVDPNKGYWYVVRALDEQGFEDQNTNEVFMPANRAPVMTVAPTVNFTWSENNPCMRVSWQAASDDSTSVSSLSYKIFRSEQPTKQSFDFTKPIDALTGGKRDFLDCSIDGVKGYSYIIRATDADNAEGPDSPIGTIAANQPPTAGAVTQVAIVGPTSVELRWNNATDDRSFASKIEYKIYRFPKWSGTGNPVRKASDFTSSNLAGSVEQGVTKFIDTNGLNATMEYAWVIRPVDEFGLEGLNLDDEVSLGANLAPAFNGLTLLSLSGLRGVNLNWPLATDDRTPQDQISYRIYYMEVPSTTPTGVDPNDPIPSGLISQLFVAPNIRQSITGTVTTVTLQVPDSNKSYLFGIRACDNANLCENNVKAFATPANTPPTFRGLESLNESSAGVNLTWLAATDDRDNSSDILYRIYRMVTDKQTVTTAEVVTAQNLYRTSAAGETTFVDDALVSSSYNHYVVRAVDKSLAEDTNSVIRSVAPDNILPVFFGIKTSTMVGARITLTWDAAVDNRTILTRIRYRVYEALQANYSEIVSTEPIAELTNGQQTFNRTPPTGAKYYYVVKAVDEAGNADLNEVVKFTEDIIPPNFAGIVTGYPVTNSSAQIFWSDTPNNDIAQIKIYRADNLSQAVASVNPRNDKGEWQNSYLVTGLTAATSYTFIARASDLFGNEEDNVVSVELVTLAGVSPLFAGLQSVSAMEGIPGMSGMDLSWSAAADATHYRIYRIMGTSSRGEEFDFNFDSCKTAWNSPSLPGCTEIPADGVSSFAATGLVKNTTYSFVARAIAKNGALVVGEEQNRIIKTAVTNDEKAPTFVGAASVMPAGGPAGVDTMELKWNPPARDGVYDGFTILYKAVADSVSSFNVPAVISTADLIGTVDVADPQATGSFVVGLAYNQRYCFTVRTRYSANPSIFSIPQPEGFVCGRPIPQPPEFAGVKTKVTPGAGPLGFSQLTVEWDQANGSFTSYEVSWSLINDYVNDAVVGSFFQDSNRAVIESRNVNYYTITNLTPNKTYYIRVRAKFQLSSPSVLLMSGGNVVAQAVTTPLAPSGDGILTAKQLGDDQIELRWDAPTNSGLFNRYYIFRGEGAAADSDVLAAITPNLNINPPYTGEALTIPQTELTIFSERRFIDSDYIVPNTRYCYVIKAAFAGPEGFVGSLNSKKACVDVEIKAPEFLGLTSISTPTSASGFTTLVLNWQPATGDFTNSKYQYRIGEAPNALGEWVDISTAVTTSSATLTGLMPNTSYFASVRAVHMSSDGQSASAGDNVVLSGLTTPLAPLHSGLEPVEFLLNPGEVRISWTSPDARPEVGGLYDRYFVWRYQDGSGVDIFSEIENLLSDSMSPGVISALEVNSSTNHVKEYDKTITSVTYQGATKLAENVQTCFLVRAAFRDAQNPDRFLMSSNQTVRCVTPTASAPQFSGLATLSNLPESSNGFTQLFASWQPATGVFTRYEVAASLTQGNTSWSTFAFTSSNIAINSALLNNTDVVNNTSGTALKTFKRYYVRARAIYVGSGNTVYSSGETTELSAVVSPDQPQEDGLKSVSTEKIPGLPPSARLVINGDVAGLWDRVAIFRSVGSDQSQASAAVIAQASVKTDLSGFVGSPLAFVNRSSPTAKTDISYVDNSSTVGMWNCYLVRAAYMSAPWFLASTAAQTPICKQPVFDPVSFSGVAATGAEVCQDQVSDEACNPAARWANTGNSRVRLKLASVPQGDIDFYDVYMGTSSIAQDLLAQGIFQTIAKNDPIHDPVGDDDYLYVGGTPNTYILGGQYYFLVRARCLGCTFIDSNTNVTNAVMTLPSYVRSSFHFLQSDPTKKFASDLAGLGQFDDQPSAQVFTADGQANLTSPTDYLRATNPGVFAPKPGRTLAFKFNLGTAAADDAQNKEGAAIFAADSSIRAPFVDTVNNGPDVSYEGSLFGLPGAVTAFDRRNGRCLWIGGYAGQSLDIGDYPTRDWSNNWPIVRRANAQRMQAFDGQNFSEIYSRGPSPLPRSQPVVAYNPIRDTVMLFGGLTQSNPQKIGADTWEWDGRQWNLLDAGPTTDQWVAGEVGRYGGNVMALDPFRNQMVMVGGRYAVQEGSTNNAAQSVMTTTGKTVSSNTDRYNLVRRATMHHFVTDNTTGVSTWQKTVTLPGTFPDGYPAALVSVPEGSAKGLYYFSFKLSATWEQMTANNVWHYNGSYWMEISNSSVPINRAHSYLYAFYEPVTQRIVLTMGRGNDNAAKRIWEYNPLLSSSGQGAWTQRFLTSAPPTLGNMPCFDPVRRQMVDYGGVIPNWNTFDALTVRERTPQDIFLYSTVSNSWSRASVAYDRSSHMGDFFGLFPKLSGVFVHGGGVPWINFWEDRTNAFASWLFKDGFWERMHNTDVSQKYRAAPGGDDSVATRSPFLLNAGVSAEVVGLTDASSWNDFNATNGKGRPATLRTFDGTGWKTETIDSTDIVFPDDRCPTLSAANQDANWALNVQYDWVRYNQVQTPWGTLLKGPPFGANLPYNDGAATVNCNAARSWKYTNSPLLILRQETGGAGPFWKTREIKPLTRAIPSDPFKFCSTVGDTTPDLDPMYKLWGAKMVWDEPRRRVLFVGYDMIGSSGRTYYTKRVQALKMLNEGDPNRQCFVVEDLVSPFPNTSWNSINTYNRRYDRPLFDASRGKLMVLSNYWTGSVSGCTNDCGNTNGFIWELDVVNKNWTSRLLPQAYRRLQAMAGHSNFHVSPFPGGSNEWLLHGAHEVHTGRALTGNFILKVTDSEISLRPALPRFGVTLGADGTSGYISVPGDKGEPGANTVGGQVVYSGRRKFANSLSGDRTLFISFNNDSTYSVFLDDMNTPVLQNIPWAGEQGGIYLNEFQLGARYGGWHRYGDYNLREYSSYGNTKVSFDWLKVFDKVLTQSERNFWSSISTEEQ